MSSNIPGGAQRLDSPPPSPANPPSPDATGPTPPGAGPPGTQSPDAGANPIKGLVAMGASIDQALSALSKAAPGSVPEFAQARKLIQKGLAKILQQAGGGTGSPSPTTAGSNFMGGGITGAM